MEPKDLEDLVRAFELLENPKLAPRLTSLVGSPIEKGLGMLPAPVAAAVRNATRVAIRQGLDTAVNTLGPDARLKSSDLLHRVLVGATGAGGGLFGVAALPIELPVSTVIMLRSIADIARSEGEDIRSLETRLACLEVFALGGRNPTDDAAETGYFAIRAALAGAVADAASHIAQHGVGKAGAPVLVRLISQIAARFGIVVSEKIAAQAIPAIGAIGGATLNLVFIDHFQDMARGHFLVRRLERAHGSEAVRREYERLQGLKDAPR